MYSSRLYTDGSKNISFSSNYNYLYYKDVPERSTHHHNLEYCINAVFHNHRHRNSNCIQQDFPIRRVLWGMELSFSSFPFWFQLVLLSFPWTRNLESSEGSTFWNQVISGVIIGNSIVFLCWSLSNHNFVRGDFESNHPKLWSIAIFSNLPCIAIAVVIAIVTHTFAIKS